MKDLAIFKFENNQDVRTIIDGNNNIWFVAKDVCNILGLSDVSMSVKRLEDSEKLVQKLFVSGQRRDILTINESGLYALVITSNKLSAKKFRLWITNDVIPSIRKTGSYSVDKYKLPASYAEALRELADTVEQRDQLQLENTKNKPKVEFYNAVASSNNLLDIQQVAKVLNFNGIGQITLFSILRTSGVLISNVNHKNEPYQKFIDKGYFKVIEQKYISNDETKIRIKTLVTQKGVEFINKFLINLGYKRNKGEYCERIH
jgi:prophage antirepressor-like protein